MEMKISTIEAADLHKEKNVHIKENFHTVNWIAMQEHFGEVA